VGGTTAGANDSVTISGSGYIDVSGNGTGGYFNREGSDGEILRFLKDDTSVGSIGSKNTDLAIGTTDVGLRFYDSGNAIYPHNVTTNVSNDDVITLGNGGARFKDLYLSGGVYLGGTGAVNKLDDYETGTWNPSENNGVTLTDNETPRYTKVGDMVHLWFDVTVATNTNGNSFDLSGIPFTANDIGCAGGAVYYCNMNNSLANAGLSFHFGTTTRAALRSGYDATVDLADMSGHRISGVLIYKATA
jgi:hypothetical protein